MPSIDKPLPDIVHEENNFLSPNADIMAQVREATYSPSPLIRILQDPSIMPTEYSENLKKGSTSRRPSRSPGRRCEHRAPIVAAIAIAEEERQGKQLKALLRASGDHLEQEMRRAADATARADFAERREREALARAEAAEAIKEELHIETMRLERDMRSYQMQLEASERETRRLQDDLADARREMNEIERGERKAQEALHKYQIILKDYERAQTAKMQEAANNCYEDGREDGYDEGYEIGYQDGRKHGLKEGIKKGRREGVREGREQGHRSERRNALEAFDRFLAEETNDRDETHRSERTRRWAQSIYRAESYSEPLEPSDSGSQQVVAMAPSP